MRHGSKEESVVYYIFASRIYEGQEQPPCLAGNAEWTEEQGREEAPYGFLNGPADRGSADGSAILLPAGDDAAVGFRLWQLFFHNLVIDACYPAVGFLSHIASANARAWAIFVKMTRSSFAWLSMTASMSFWK